MSQERAGSILDGKYEILELLGSGGMGEIFLVRHVHLEQERVVKILRKDLAADEAARKRFLREARLATHIKHPNVATLYDFARLPDDSFYMVWEYINGLEIGQILERDGPLPIPHALQLAIQALRGLEAIHSQGVIHRDVSPDNLMVTRDHRGRMLLKIIDLGLAKALAKDSSVDISQAGMFMGKLRYCSPEQAEMDGEDQLDARTDLYSFGLVLYEIICGMPPFESESTAGFVFKRLSEDPLPLAGRNPQIEVPPALSTVLATALQRDRNLRFSDAIRFIEALEPIAFRLGEAATQPISLESAGGRRPRARASSSDPARRTTSQITRKERSELLAQIDRAARRVKETSKLFEHAEHALMRGDLTKAEAIVTKLKRVNPRAAGLGQLEEKLRAEREPQLKVKAPATPSPAPATRRASEPVPRPQPSPEVPRRQPQPERKPPPAPAPPAPPPEVAEEPSPEPDRKAQVQAAEEMLARYLREGKRNLAELALGSLLELAPNHPRRGDFEEWIRLAGKEESQRAQVQEAVNTGRRALERGDFKVARRQLETARKNDPSGSLTDSFAEELAAAERSRSQSEELEAQKVRFDKSLEKERFDEAEQILQGMLGLGLTRVAATYFRSRLDSARDDRREEATVERARKRIDERLQAADFKGARDLVQTLATELPRSQAPARLLAAVSRSEEEHRRRTAIRQGEQQVEELMAGGNPGGAALALKILKQMDPENPRWKQLEKRIAALRA